MTLTINKVATLEGELRAPSDKSLTHRAYMFASIATGESIVRTPLRGEDCESTLRCMTQLGLKHEWLSETVVRLMPPTEWRQPTTALDCGNSGTTMRLLSGLLASRDLDCTLIGDASLSRRPMKRIGEPLRLMGATFEGDKPPIRIKGGNLKGIHYTSPVASAQVKSCCLLAGLRADGETTVTEPSLSRDHTERMLTAMGAHVIRSGGDFGVDPLSSTSSRIVSLPPTVSVHATSLLNPFEFAVPADISSAAFFIVAASILPQARLGLLDLSVNPTRTGIFDVLEQCRVPFEIGNERDELGEPVADAIVGWARDAQPFTIEGALVPRLIDEIPVLAVLATQCLGTSIIRDARELRVKESDRIELVANGLRSMGAVVETFEDGMAISGPTALTGATIEADGDHRIAMAFAIAGLIAEGTTTIHGADAIATSYPQFESDLQRLTIV
jgi:3-phosphoshikimate 1-carboxyvinyltransferase